MKTETVIDLILKLLLVLGVFYIGSTMDFYVGKMDVQDVSVHFNDYVPGCLTKDTCELVIKDSFAYLIMQDGSIIPLNNDMMREGVLRELR